QIYTLSLHDALPIFVQCVEHSRCGTGRRGSLHAHTIDRIAMPACDEPLLERKAPVRRVEPGANRVVARREDARLDPERGNEASGYGGQRLSGVLRLGAHEVKTEVTV